MTTPATFLAVFCGALACIEVVRYLRADDRTRLETGTMLVVVGIALAAGGWAAADRSASRLSVIGLATGAAAVLAGVALAGRARSGGSASGADGGSSRRL